MKYTMGEQKNAYEKAEAAIKANKPLTTLTKTELEALSELVGYLLAEAALADLGLTDCSEQERAQLAQVKSTLLEALATARR